MIRTRILLPVLLALAAFVAPAAAAVRLQFGVSPDTLAHCGRAHVAIAMWNDAPDTLRVRLYLSLTFRDSTNFEPVALRAKLGGHAIHQRSFEVPVPSILPIGRYTVHMLAVASDSSRSEVTQSFVVVPSACTLSDVPMLPASFVIDAIAGGSGLDQSTPTVRGTWGELKRRYDGASR